MSNNIDHIGPVISNCADGTNIIDCEVCGFKHVYPLPTDEDLNKIYTEEFYKDKSPKYIELAEEDADWYQDTLSRRLEHFELLLDTSGPFSAIDIGSGPGMFLDAAKHCNWEALGIEPSKIASKYCLDKGHNVLNNFFNSDLADSLSNKFDAAHLNNVLEHIKDPAELLDDVKKVLKPGGVICVTVPNEYNPLQQSIIRNLEHKEWWVAPKHHLNYFDFDSLEQLLTKTGFTCRSRESDFPMELFILMGDDYIAAPEIGRSMHNKRKTLERNLTSSGHKSICADFYRALAQCGLGRNATVYATLD